MVKKIIRIERYEPKYKGLWDDFVTSSKNGVFLFYRDYMEYHSDRFRDHSILFFEQGKLIAVMPANVHDSLFVSHDGLTFGGIVSNSSMKISRMLEVFDSLVVYLRDQSLDQLIYKAMPHIYHTFPAEEDLYGLFCQHAQIIRRDVSSTIDMRLRMPFSNGRKGSIKKAKKYDLVIRETGQFETFMAMEEYHLMTHYHLKPVHSAAEIKSLHRMFPNNIRLFGAYREEVMVAGIMIYESTNVAHAQYIAANEEGKTIGALDEILDFLINERYATKRYVDFGISTEREGQYLNLGLVQNKESFGARTTVHDFYSLDLV